MRRSPGDPLKRGCRQVHSRIRPAMRTTDHRLTLVHQPRFDTDSKAFWNSDSKSPSMHDRLQPGATQFEKSGRGIEISGLRSSARGLAMRGSLAPAPALRRRRPRCDPASVARTRIAYRREAECLELSWTGVLRRRDTADEVRRSSWHLLDIACGGKPTAVQRAVVRISLFFPHHQSTR